MRLFGLSERKFRIMPPDLAEMALNVLTDVMLHDPLGANRVQAARAVLRIAYPEIR